MSIWADVGSFIESKTSVVQTSNVGFTSEVSDYLVVHTVPGLPWGQDRRSTQAPRSVGTAGKVYPSSSSWKELGEKANFSYYLFRPGPPNTLSPNTHSLSLSLSLMPSLLHWTPAFCEILFRDLKKKQNPNPPPPPPPPPQKKRWQLFRHDTRQGNCSYKQWVAAHPRRTVKCLSFIKTMGCCSPTTYGEGCTSITGTTGCCQPTTYGEGLFLLRNHGSAVHPRRTARKIFGDVRERLKYS